jgi:hypothetical protein
MSDKPPKQPDNLIRSLVVVFLVTLAGYFAFFYLIENRRTVHSPWLLSMEAGADGTLRLVARQETMKLGPVEIVLPGAAAGGLARTNLIFATPQPFPRPAPRGDIKFEDLTFLPGTVAMRIQGTDLQVLPRSLTVGTNEILWPDVRLVEVISNRVVRLEP